VALAAGIRVDNELGFGDFAANCEEGRGNRVDPDQFARSGCEFGECAIRERWMPVRAPRSPD
jgi:hypothetical protein